MQICFWYDSFTLLYYENCILDFQGRLLPDHFPSIFGPNEDLPLDYEIVKIRFIDLTQQINEEIDGHLNPEEVALGFLDIADEVSFSVFSK